MGVKLGTLDISSFKVGSADCKVYLGETLIYSGDTPTPPTPSYMFTATYSDGTSYSAECTSSAETLTTATTRAHSTRYAAMTSAVIGDCVTTIGREAFNACTSITSITIPSGVTSIETDAFNYMKAITSITVNAITPPSMGYRVFNDTNNCPIYVPSGSVDSYKAASGWSNYASRIQAIQT